LEVTGVSTTDRPNGEDGATSVTQFASDLALLVRKELESAREEMVEKAKSAGIGAGMLSASAISVLFALAALTALVTIALASAIPLWAAALVVTVLWCAVAAVLALLGKKKVEDAAPFVPEQTIAEVKEDLEWARAGAKSLRK
jgi:uncharacterized membrane protein YqjE